MQRRLSFRTVLFRTLYHIHETQPFHRSFSLLWFVPMSYQRRKTFSESLCICSVAVFVYLFCSSLLCILSVDFCRRGTHEKSHGTNRKQALRDGKDEMKTQGKETRPRNKLRLNRKQSGRQGRGVGENKNTTMQANKTGKQGTPRVYEKILARTNYTNCRLTERRALKKKEKEK